MVPAHLRGLRLHAVSILLDAILRSAINPALSLLPVNMDSDRARVEMLAAGLQESELKKRYQTVHGDPYAKGPARGLWQNERGGVQAVMTNPATREHAIVLCAARKRPFDVLQVHASLEYDDILAAGFARLLLWADPKPLPELDDSKAGWETYLRCWRPGKPRPDDWPHNHAAARAQVIA
jgi:hypothetical protein